MAKTDINVQLSGQDGNAFNLIGIVMHALRKNNKDDLIEELQAEIDVCPSFDALLQLLQKYVVVS